MQIKTWSNFSKRVNSTKQPLDSGATIKTVVLKEMCDILAPSFILDTTDFNINYVQAFGNYYFAQCFNLDGHRTEIKCSLDHLATFKSQIGSYTGLIEYCSNSSNVHVTDPRNNPTCIIDTTATSMPFSDISFNTVGGYIVGVLSDAANGASGVVDYYALTEAQMAAFCNELYSQNILDRIKDQFTNAMDSLVSCIWLPLTGIGSGGATIHVGREVLNNVGTVSKITDRIKTFTTGSVSIGFSANSGGAGSSMTYLEKAPYCSGELYLPFVGWVSIDMDLCAYYKTIQLDGAVDLLTGDIVYKVRYGGGWVSTYNGNIATKLPVTGASYDGIGVATGTISAIGGVGAAIIGGVKGLGAKAVGMGLGAAFGGALTAAKSAEFHTMINGGNSSAIGATIGTTPYALIHQYVPEETSLLTYKTTHGMPYNKVGTVSACGGYVQTADASVSIPGDGAEQDVVNNYLNSGIYYE